MCVMDPTDQAEIEFDFLFHVKKVFFFLFSFFAIKPKRPFVRFIKENGGKEKDYAHVIVTQDTNTRYLSYI